MSRTDFIRIGIFLFVVTAVHLFSSAGEGNERFVIGDIAVEAGKMESGYLAVPEKEGIRTRIPVTVVNGSKPGKVLAFVAGVHGYEYPPILALYRLKNTIDPSELSGTLILVHIANLQSFLNIYR